MSEACNAMHFFHIFFVHVLQKTLARHYRSLKTHRLFLNYFFPAGLFNEGFNRLNRCRTVQSLGQPAVQQYSTGPTSSTTLGQPAVQQYSTNQQYNSTVTGPTSSTAVPLVRYKHVSNRLVT
jgi:hypothetical protein